MTTFKVVGANHPVAFLGIGALLVAWAGCGGILSVPSNGSADGGAGGSGSGSSASSGSSGSSGTSSGVDATTSGSSGSVGDSGSDVQGEATTASSSGGSSGGGSGSGSGSASGGGSGGDGCVPRTCQSFGYTCGTIGDTCGGTIGCGICLGNDWCGGGGPNKCGSGTTGSIPDSGSCTGGCCPKTCSDYPAGTCGVQSDGCGGLTTDCGTCVAPEYCGGGGPGLCGGHSGVCGFSQCVPLTCRNLAAECGLSGDGCGELLDCGSCPPLNSCGSDLKCHWLGDAGSCVPYTCASLGYRCGSSSDGCGGWLADCGTCPVDQFCGGGGSRQCGGSCSIPDGGCALMCSSDGGDSCIGVSAAGYCAGWTCGMAPNGCGGLVDCGVCAGDAGATDGPAE